MDNNRPAWNGAFAWAEPSFELDKVIIEPEVQSIMTAKWQDEFKHIEYPHQWLNHVISVAPGESIQEAIDSASDAGVFITYFNTPEFIYIQNERYPTCHLFTD